ncbi:MAG: ferrous iron transport protein B, partial [bacterium]|nr:ferrous iron transport protein B [bacterium]
LSKALGVPVITAIATMRVGIHELKQHLTKFVRPHFHPEFHPVVEEAVKELAAALPNNGCAPRGAALSVLSGDKTIIAALHHNQAVPEQLHATVNANIAKTKERFFEPLSFLVSRTRKQNIEERFGSYIVTPQRTVPVWRERLGNWMMHPLWGLPFLLLVLYLMYELVGVWAAGDLVDLIENGIFGGIDAETGEVVGYINPFIINLLAPLKQYGAVGTFFVDMFVGQYGLITVGLTYAIAIVLPVIFFFFLAFGILEDSGYLPRLTILSNRLFKRIGLNGRAVLPMVLGLGCDTMATFTTRTLETKKERIIATLLLGLGVPCSAQLGVILGMSSALNPLVLAIIAVTVVMQLVIVGWTANKILPGKVSSFLMEIPPIRTPRIKNLLIKTLFRVKWFLVEAVPLFLIGTGILFVVDRIGLLTIIENATKPILAGLLDLPAESAKAFLLGFLRRDYGAAGLFMLEKQGLLDLTQVTVSLAVMILFIPCLASFFAIIKEQGMKTGIVMATFISVYAVAVGAVLNIILRSLHVFA